MRFLSIYRIILSLILVHSAFAYNIPERPQNSYVHDEPDWLTPKQELLFNQWAEALHKQAGFSLAVALVNDIGDEEYRSVALEIASKWGLGNKESSEAALIFVALNQKRRSIEVGYGAEPYLTDLETKDIQEAYLVPAFQQGRFGLGILTTAQAIAQKVGQAKQVSITPLTQAMQASSHPVSQEEALYRFFQKHPFLFVLVFILFLFIKMKSGSMYLGPRGFGGGFSSGSRGSRSSFGGGFGGGRFGGGGSGGSW